MTARATRFTQTDLKRAVKGASAAGFRVGRIEIDANGTIVIMSETVVAHAPDYGCSESWDEVLVQ